jgi:hypothetical protein
VSGTKRLLVALRIEGNGNDADQSDRGGRSAPLSAKGKAAVGQAEGERYTPLMSRETYTYALMRDDRPGPRMYSAICFPGWKKG